MPAIGNYSTRYVIIRRGEGVKESAFGQVKYPYDDDTDEAWGFPPDEGGASVRRSARQVEARAETTIRLRGRVTIGAYDRLRVKSGGDLYQLEGVRYDSAANETICDGARRTEQD